MQKYLFLVIIILGISLIGGIIYFTLPKPENGNMKGEIDYSKTVNHEVVKGEIKEFNVRSFNWGFDPEEIVVNLGDKVNLHVTTDDIDHGLAINEFLVNKRVQPGLTTDIEFVADKKGTFEIYCSVPCGEGHLSMKGRLIVR